jgi:uncharacterized protein YjbI with pentapeptide repeats
MDFSKASLYQAVLTKWTLVRVDLRASDLTQADLSGAELSGAFLDNARRYEPNLSGAACTQEQLNAAEGSDDTRISDGLSLPTHWKRLPPPPNVA